MTLAFFEALALFSFFWWIGPKPMERPSFAQGNDQRADSVFMRDRNRARRAREGTSRRDSAARRDGNLPAERAAHRRGNPARVSAGSDPRHPDRIELVRRMLRGGRYGFLHRQIGSENVGRFFGSLGAMSPLYYVVPLLLNSAPLSLFVPIAGRCRIRHSSRPGAPAIRAVGSGPPRGGPPVRIFLDRERGVLLDCGLQARRAYLLAAMATIRGDARMAGEPSRRAAWAVGGSKARMPHSASR